MDAAFPLKGGVKVSKFSLDGTSAPPQCAKLTGVRNALPDRVSEPEVDHMRRASATYLVQKAPCRWWFPSQRVQGIAAGTNKGSC